MDRVSGLSDELLIKILSFLPTKDAVSTSILSKQWEFLWMWLPKLEYATTNYEPNPALRDFIDRNLPLHKAPVIESLSLKSIGGLHQPEDIKRWAGIAVSRCVRELNIRYVSRNGEPEVLVPDVVLPSSLYTCKSLVTLKLEGMEIFVDVSGMVSLPSLKTLKLQRVTYLNDDSIRLLLSSCPVLEDLVIQRHEDDNVKTLIVIDPSLQRLTLEIDGLCSDDGYVLYTPSLKYFKVEEDRDYFSCLIEHMPELEEADISVQQDPEKLLESITSVKRLSLNVAFNGSEKPVYRAGIAFNQLEELKLCIGTSCWSKLLVRLLNDSPKLRVLNIYLDFCTNLKDYKRIRWDKKQSSAPECLLRSLETFEFVGYSGRPEERDFLSFFFKNARCLKSSSIQSSTIPNLR